MRAEEALRIQREERKIEEYAERKERLMQLRKQREHAIFAEKQKLRQRMIDKQAARLSDASG